MIIDDLFHINSRAPTSLHVGSPLRPILHAAFASLIMYSSERTAHAEMNGVTVFLRESVGRILSHVPVGQKPPTVLATRMLNQWATGITAKFATDNVHLTNPQPQDHLASSSFVNIINQLGMQHSVLMNTITELRSEVKTLQSSFTTLALQSQVHT